MRHKARYILYVFIFALSFLGCKKENVDYTYDYRRDVTAQKSSNVRLINLSQNPQLIADDDTLTNFYMIPQRSGYISPEELTYPATKYFPSNGRLGQSWFVPQELFSKDGKVTFKTTFVPTPTSNIASHDMEFTASEDHSNPKDYYLLINHEGMVQDPTSYVEVPRSITAPARADHFKIRVINFSKALPSSNPMEPIAGPISLAYADGTLVNAATNNVGANQWSSYVEVPYGTYQFKLLTTDGRQIPALGQSYYDYIDLPTSTMEMSSGTIPRMSSGLTYAPIQTFQPGGIYTIVVHPGPFAWTNGRDDFRNVYQNSFRIITDVSEPQNRTFSRIQLANASYGQELTLKVKGHSTASTAYGNASEYERVVSGKQTIEVTSASGQLLLSQEAELLAGSNYTLWVYPDGSNAVKSLLANNNLAGTSYTGVGGNGNNATVDRVNSSFFFDYRFLNFCPQIPYATFTDGDGRPFSTDLTAGNGVNVSPYMLNIGEPYASVTYSRSDDQGNAYQFMLFNSALGRVPGDWIKDIEPMSSQQLVANKTLYTKVGRKVPAHEPGVYSIALIGKLGNASDAEKVRLMVVKHTK